MEVSGWKEEKPLETGFLCTANVPHATILDLVRPRSITTPQGFPLRLLFASRARCERPYHLTASSSTDRRSRSNSRPPSSISRSSYSSSLVDDFFFFFFLRGKQIFLRKRTIRWNDESIKMRSNDEIDRWNFKYLKI